VLKRSCGVNSLDGHETQQLLLLGRAPIARGGGRGAPRAHRGEERSGSAMPRRMRNSSRAGAMPARNTARQP